MSRYFKKSFGMPPQKYRQWLRTVHAMTDLLQGEAITDVSGIVGYEDLGRFYKQFKEIAHTPPGTYAKAGKSKNAKK